MSNHVVDLISLPSPKRNDFVQAISRFSMMQSEAFYWTRYYDLVVVDGETTICYE